MKYNLIILLLCIPISLFSQTWESMLNEGIVRYNELDYDSAIAIFDAALIQAKDEGASQDAKDNINVWLKKARNKRLNALREQLIISEKRGDKLDSTLSLIFRYLDQRFYNPPELKLGIKAQGSGPSTNFKFGYLDAKDEVVVPHLFDAATPYSSLHGYAIASTGDTKYLIQNDGKKLVLAESVDEINAETTALIFKEIPGIEEWKKIPKKNRIEAVYLTALGLKEVPAFLKRFSNIKLLDLGGNKLESLPDWMANFDKLESLYINSNNLAQFPNLIVGFRKLKELNLNRNDIRGKPNGVDMMASLDKLFLSHNEINAFPKNQNAVSKLKILDLSSNKLKAAQLNFSKYKDLEILNLSGNGLANLPEGISQIKTLESLILIDEYASPGGVLSNYSSVVFKNANGKIFTGVLMNNQLIFRDNNGIKKMELKI